MTIEVLDLRLTHIEKNFEDIRSTVKATNERVDQIYHHIISSSEGRKENSSNRKASWKQWGGATILSILALVIALWDRLAAASPS